MRACWLKWVGRDWSISADYIWLNYSGANTAATIRPKIALLSGKRDEKRRHIAEKTITAPTARFVPRDSAVRFSSSKRPPDSDDIPASNPVSLPRYIIIPNTSSRHDPTIGTITSDIAITQVHSLSSNPCGGSAHLASNATSCQTVCSQTQILCMSSNAPV